jgi:NADPH2:quinone reductase
VIATVSSAAKAEQARAAGADACVDYKTADVVEAVTGLTNGLGVDHIVDVDLGGNLPVSLKIARANATVVGYASAGNFTPTVPMADLMRKNIAVRGFMLPGTPASLRREAQREITRWLEQARPLHRIAGVFKLADTVLAHQAVEAGTKVGTVVVNCA